MINNFDELISSGYHLVDFNATWCNPCKMMDEVLKSLDEDIDIIKIDVDKNKKTTLKYRIMSIPTIILFKDGNIVKEITGLISKEELESIIKENR